MSINSGKLLKFCRSLPSKKEAVTLLRQALDIRTNKLGSEHKLTHAVRRVLKLVQKELVVGDYDYAPVKPPDKRTKENPNSALSWHYQDLNRFEKRSLTRSAKSQSQGGWRDTTERSNQRGRAGSSRMGSSSHKMQDDRHWRARTQSAPIGDGNRERGNDDDASLESQFQRDLLITEQANYETVSLGRGKTHSGRLSHQGGDRRWNESRSQSAMSQQEDGWTEIRSKSAMSQQRGGWTESRSKSATGGRRQRSATCSASTRISGHSQWTESRPATGFSGRRSASRGSQYRSDSRISFASHDSRCDMPLNQFAMHPSNAKAIRSPHSEVRHLLGDPPCPRDLEVKVVHKAAWYHEPNRYPKNAYDEYPPRRHQVRPGNRFSWADVVSGNGNPV